MKKLIALLLLSLSSFASVSIEHKLNDVEIREVVCEEEKIKVNYNAFLLNLNIASIVCESLKGQLIKESSNTANFILDDNNVVVEIELLRNPNFHNGSVIIKRKDKF